MKVLVGGSTVLDFTTNNHRGNPSKASFLWWIENHLASVKVHAAGQLAVFRALRAYLDREPMGSLSDSSDSVDTVVEFFGGSGIGPAIIQSLFHPVQHRAYDIDPECVAHLLSQRFSSRLEVVEADAKEAMLAERPSDLAVLDFFSFSAYRISDWRRQLDVVFGLEPRAVQITDTSLARLPLQRERYSEALGVEVTDAPSYLQAFSDKFHRDYGYSAIAAAYREFACLMLVPSKVPNPVVLTKLDKQAGDEAVQTW